MCLWFIKGNGGGSFDFAFVGRYFALRLSHAQYDVPNVIAYILQATGAPSLSYVGHSEGTIQMFASLIR